MSNKTLVMVVMAIFAAGSPGWAQQIGEIRLHGTGSWSVGRSDPYEYLQGGGEGVDQWLNVDFMLNIDTSPAENLRINAQLWNEIEGAESESDLEVVFAEWTVSDLLHVKGGLSRVPFGVYANIFDIGTLRPLYSLPQAVYGRIGLIPEGYAGIGLWGQTGDDWHMVYDVYAGGMKIPTIDMYEMFVEDDPAGAKRSEQADPESMIQETLVRDIVGGQLKISPPWDGLTFGVSAYAGTRSAMEDAAESESSDGDWGDHRVYGVQLEYADEDNLLRTEYVIGERTNHIESFYIEFARMVFGPWQIAARYETIDVDPDGEIVAGARTLLTHEERVIGLNYWLNSSAVVKLTGHAIEGNLLTHPEGAELLEAVEGGNLDTSSMLVTFGIQFSF